MPATKSGIRPVNSGRMLFRTVLTLLLSLLFIQPVFSQNLPEKKLKIGLTGGLIYSNIIESKESRYEANALFELKQLPGYAAGLRISYLPGRNAVIHTGFSYSNVRYNIEQQSFPASGLKGRIKTIFIIQGLDIPLFVTYKIESDSRILNNLTASLGTGIAFYELKGIRSKGNLTMAVSDTIFWEMRDTSPPDGKTITPFFQAGFGKQFKIDKKEFQINLWYSGALKALDARSVSYLLNKKHVYDIKTQPFVSAFKLEFVYYPWEL